MKEAPARSRDPSGFFVPPPGAPARGAAPFGRAGLVVDLWTDPILDQEPEICQPAIYGLGALVRQRGTPVAHACGWLLDPRSVPHDPAALRDAADEADEELDQVLGLLCLAGADLRDLCPPRAPAILVVGRAEVSARWAGRCIGATLVGRLARHARGLGASSCLIDCGPLGWDRAAIRAGLLAEPDGYGPARDAIRAHLCRCLGAVPVRGAPDLCHLRMPGEAGSR